MDLVVDVRAARVLQGLAMSKKACDFAIVNALNSTAKLIQARERARVRSKFVVRRREFIERQAAVIRQAQGGSGFASVRDQRFDVRIAVGEKPRLLLPKFESGATRGPFTAGARNVAVPEAARPNRGASVRPELFIKALHLRRRHGQIQGGLGTFIIPRRGVYQRRGPDVVRLLYRFVPTVRLAPVLRFIPTATETAAVAFPVALTGELTKTLGYIWGR